MVLNPKLTSNLFPLAVYRQRPLPLCRCTERLPLTHFLEPDLSEKSRGSGVTGEVDIVNRLFGGILDWDYPSCVQCPPDVVLASHPEITTSNRRSDVRRVETVLLACQIV